MKGRCRCPDRIGCDDLPYFTLIFQCVDANSGGQKKTGAFGKLLVEQCVARTDSAILRLLAAAGCEAICARVLAS